MIGKVRFVLLDNRLYCMNGWAGTSRKPACNYTGGHFCDLLLGHKSPCRCSCGSKTSRNRWLEEQEKGTR